MTSQKIIVTKYTADEGKVFDYAVPRYDLNDVGMAIRQHFYQTNVIIGLDEQQIEDYIEVELTHQEEEKPNDTNAV